MAGVRCSIFVKATPDKLRLRDLTIDRALPKSLAARLITTLVLESDPPDFSTDVDNSALIATTKSPQRHSRLPGGEEK
jgi:hypothetical protein